jgi:hypothetical protein
MASRSGVSGAISWRGGSFVERIIPQFVCRQCANEEEYRPLKNGLACLFPNRHTSCLKAFERV